MYTISKIHLREEEYFGKWSGKESDRERGGENAIMRQSYSRLLMFWDKAARDSFNCTINSRGQL